MRKFKNYEDFILKLQSELGIQVYDERTDKTGVKTPYIVCSRLQDSSIRADNIRFTRIDTIEAVLFSYQKNGVASGERSKAEAKISDWIEKNAVTIFDFDSAWQEEIQLHMSVFSFGVAYESDHS